MDFSYVSGKLLYARRALLAPHPKGEEDSFRESLWQCRRAFHGFDFDSVSDSEIDEDLKHVRRLLDTEGVTDPTGEGTHLVVIRAMTTEQRAEFARAVDRLATWFRDQVISRRER